MINLRQDVSSISLLEPDWSQRKPSSHAAGAMCQTIALTSALQSDERIQDVLQRLRTTCIHGGAFLAVIKIASDPVFDWFASRNRLLEYDILAQLLQRAEIRNLLPELQIPEASNTTTNQSACNVAGSTGFVFDDPFLLTGQLARWLFSGGAYGSSYKISGPAAMQMAAAYCEAAFQTRFEEVSLFSRHDAWTPWFHGIAWDWTSVIFDKRERKLHILAMTDTD